MEFSEYYVAYFDVLGYKEAFKKSEDISAKLIESIESSVDLMKQIVSIINAPSDESIDKKTDIEYKIFSDNILICYKKTTSSISAIFLVSFLRLIATIQRIFFEGYHLIVRGGITKGPLYLTNDFVGGKALVDAVELESTTIYPRIVVADCILNDLNSEIQNDLQKYIIGASCRDLLIKNADNKSFLNYIVALNPWIWFPKNTLQSESIESFEEFEKNVREGRQRKPMYNPDCLKEVFVILKKHKHFIEKNVNEYSQSLNNETDEKNRLRILEKYLWLVSFHNKICEELYNTPDLKINLKSEFNEQTLAFDVSVG